MLLAHSQRGSPAHPCWPGQHVRHPWLRTQTLCALERGQLTLQSLTQLSCRQQGPFRKAAAGRWPAGTAHEVEVPAKPSGSLSSSAEAAKPTEASDE